MTIVAVTGATGSQGGGVVDALLSETKAKVRALTRNTSSSRAKALPAGVDVLEADLADKASLVKAFEGVDIVFLVTDFQGGAGHSADTEIMHGKNGIDAAKEAGVKYVIFSTLEDLPLDVKEKLPPVDGMTIPHFETKGKLSEYLKESGLDYALLYPSMFYENLIKFTPYQQQPDASYVFGDCTGTKPHAWNAVGDIGLTAAAVVNDPAKWKGQSIPVVGQHISNLDVAQIISNVTGKTVRYHAFTDEEFASFPFPGAKEFANMYSYFRQFPYFDNLRPLDKRAVVGPSFKEWAEAHREQLLEKLEPA